MKNNNNDDNLHQNLLTAKASQMYNKDKNNSKSKISNIKHRCKGHRKDSHLHQEITIWGWVCPVCGKVNSPKTTQCNCDGWKLPAFTCGAKIGYDNLPIPSAYLNSHVKGECSGDCAHCERLIQKKEE